MNARLLNRRRKRFFRQVRFEPLESRWLLSGSGLDEYATVSPEWFTTALNVSTAAPGVRVGSVSGASGTASGSGGEQFVDRWIVRLTPAATGQLGSVGRAEHLLDTLTANFQVIRGLGLPGQLLLHSFAPYDVARAALAANPHVAYFEPDSVVYAQQTPDDPFFSNMTNLHNVGQFGSTAGADIDAPQAWTMNTGSPSVVVGVIDSGVDLAHPDLYLNVWINQSEIPAATGEQVVDIDGDGLITFYDLNDPANADLVTDHNGNGYIDALDLLQDPRWANGRDTSGNGFVDDLFGWNFRTAAGEPFAPNNPSDVLGHGTHVAGTIGAIGDNSRGVTGINWRSSIMALKFLDDRNTGETSQAIAAINYATMMRTRYGTNVRVLNNSWGQAGGFSHNLHAAISASEDADILFVAAAGNGNVLGQGLNNDRTPFYPASYELDNVIAVAATDPDDRLARFSNFGQRSVHIAAPGIGILSTLPGSRYGTANGTSMAAPHVAGVAALVWSEVPEASVAEVRTAILAGVDELAELQGRVASGGRLNAFNALDSEHFAPTARLLEAADIHTATDAPHTIVVQYTDRRGIDVSTLGSGEIFVDRQWGPRDRITATLLADSVTVSGDGKQVTAAYEVLAPGGTWDAFAYGEYNVSVDFDRVYNLSGLPVRPGDLGSFRVQIFDPSIIYVDTYQDVPEGTSLRTAIREANAAGEPRTIILDAGTYRLSIPAQPDLEDPFPTPPGTVADGRPRTWSNETTGDLAILGQVTILGDDGETTLVDGGGIDRVFRVYPDAMLDLHRIGVTGGHVTDVSGGGILSMGTLNLDRVVVADNHAEGPSGFGGGIALWGGQTSIVDTTIRANTAYSGGGMFTGNDAIADIARSTVMTNVAELAGGGFYWFDGGVNVINATLSTNEAGSAGGAIYARGSGAASGSPSLSADGRFIAFESEASNLAHGDTNNMRDIFVVDKQSGSIERASVADDGTQANDESYSPSLSADGRFVAFESRASNLVPGDTNDAMDVFVFDRQSGSIERVSVANDGIQANGDSSSPSLSADGRFVAFHSDASNLVSGDTNNTRDVFVFDRQTASIERVSVADDGTQANGDSYSPSLSADGRFVAFVSSASNLVPGDTNNRSDVFLFDRQIRSIERVSVANDGTEGNNSSRSPSVSSNGRFVAFESLASNLVPGDTNNRSDVFLFDRQTASIERVSVADDGTQANGDSYSPSLSADGRFVAFESFASNLVPGDTNWRSDVFVFDRQSESIERVSIADDGTQADGASSLPSVSADGRFVAFESLASNLVPVDTNWRREVFGFDRQARTVDKLSSPRLGDASYLVLRNVTVAENRTASGEAVVGHVQTHNSLFVHNRTAVGWSSDLGVGVQSLGYNLLETALEDWEFSWRFTDIESENIPVIGPLRENGGPTWTHALLPGSPAINAADPVDYPIEDQRGLSRPQDGAGDYEPRADVGAVERYFAKIEGTVYFDRNRDGKRDADEPGLVGWHVYLDSNFNSQYDHGELQTWTRPDDPATWTIREDGRYSFAGLNPRTFEVALSIEPGWTLTLPRVQLQPVSMSDDGTEADDDSYSSSLSADGRFVAFVSWASNLVPGDTNNASDVFVFDRQTGSIERASIADDGTEADDDSDSPSLSADGRFVAFESDASNLVPGDTNDASDVFVFDRQTGSIERVSVADDGTEANNDSYSPSLSADGRFVAFASTASNLVPGDTNGTSDVFVFDRQSHSIERISVADDGTEGNARSESPSLSADGRFVAFVSRASNLVPGDTNDASDVFVFDRQTGSIERVSVADDGTEANNDSYSPSLSADGRFVAFESDASSLVPGDTNWRSDVFVFDRQTGSIERVSIADDGTQGNGDSSSPSLSPDGRFVAFESNASNLLPGWDPFDKHVFVVRNRLGPGGDPGLLWLHAGQVLSELDFGLVPEPGEISGRIFEDVIANEVYDPGEPLLEDVTVYLDLNFNGRWDPGEPKTQSAADGTYSFTGIESYMEYQIGVVVPDGFSLVLPTADDNGLWQVFLPAGGTLADRDFGFRKVAPGGQFENAVIEGRLFRDDNGNGVFDEGEIGLTGWTVFLDLSDDGVRRFNEPWTLTASDGSYSFPNLGNRPYTVRAIPEARHLQTGPVGSEFAVQERTVPLPTGAAASPQDVVAADFTGDGHPDLAVALYDHNAVSLLLNDGHGRFDQAPITIELAPAGLPTGAPRGLNPSALVAGDFNGSGSLDLAVVNSSSSNVAILLDFDGTGFASKTFVPVGTLPSSITAGYVAGEDKVAFLAVTNEYDNTVSILRNNGHGVFAADPSPIPVGNRPASIVAGYFNDDPYPDLAVANYGTHPSGSDLGHVSILLADGPNGFHPAQLACPVGMGPASLVVADLDGDGRADLAVANFLSNTVTVCAGAGDGTFTAVAELSAGSGPVDITVADLDGSGRPDLLVANVTSKDVAILRNRSAPGTFQFEPPESYGVARFAGGARLALAVADFDGSGLTDLVVANNADRNVSVHLNTLVAGAHRVALIGVETVSGLDFALKPLNLPPTLDPIADQTVDKDAGEHGVALAGISDGDDGSQPLAVTAVSSDPSLIPDPVVDYADGSSSGTLRFSPAAGRSGTALITVTVTDGGLDKDLSTPEDNATLSRTFQVVVNDNDVYISPIPDPPPIERNAPQQTVIVTGIASGRGRSQPLAVTARSDREDIIPTPAVSYTSPDSIAVLTYRPVPDAHGTAVITVTVMDGGPDGDLATEEDNVFRSESFTVTVTAVNHPPQLDDRTFHVDENVPHGTVVGIASATDADPGDTHSYSILSGNAAGVFSIAADTGEITVNVPPGLDYEWIAQFVLTVRVVDSAGAADEGTITILVNDLNEPPIVAFPIPDQQTYANRPFTFTFDADAFQDPDDGDVLTFTATGAAGSPLPGWLGFEPSTRKFSGTPGLGDVGVFEVVVTAQDSGGLGVSDTFVLTVLSGNSWHNQSNPYDVNGDGAVTPMDVLDLINHLNAHGSGPLPSTPEPPPYLDVNNDGDITPSDVLAVINYLNAQVPNAEGEAAGRMSVGTPADVGLATPQAAWFPDAAVMDRVVGPWSCEPFGGRAADVSSAPEADRLLFVHTPPGEREILPYFSGPTDGMGSSDELEDVLAEIACDIAEAFLAL